MRIGGLLKNSFIDFPSRISAVVFVAGCNFHCPYCHNPDLATDRIRPLLDQEEVLQFLVTRRSLLDGVVISGGEPTLDTDLAPFLYQVKQLGYAIKLDTNGSRPETLQVLLQEGLVDYLAMDIKTTPEAYPPSLVTHLAADVIPRSIAIAMRSGIDCEFRTTCAPPFINEAVIRTILPHVKGARNYVLQHCREETLLDRSFYADSPCSCSPEQLAAYQALLATVVERCSIR